MSGDDKRYDCIMSETTIRARLSSVYLGLPNVSPWEAFALNELLALRRHVLAVMDQLQSHVQKDTSGKTARWAIDCARDSLCRFIQEKE